VVRQFWGRAAGRPAIRRGTLVFWAEKLRAEKEESGRPYHPPQRNARPSRLIANLLAPVMIPIAIFVLVMIAVLHFVTISIRPVAISISIAGLGVSPAAIIGVMVISPPVISVMVICVPTVGRVALVFTEARVIAEASFVLPSPVPIFLLAFAVEPVVFDVIVTLLGQPLPVIWVIRSVIAAVPAVSAISGIRIVLIPMFRASGRQNCS
jgi:hypothetical protein